MLRNEVIALQMPGAREAAPFYTSSLAKQELLRNRTIKKNFFLLLA
jgi:hypothetical protein